ncbi:MAG: protein translocase SEC61 complex subunit gamma [Nitrososphaerota archaeon]
MGVRQFAKSVLVVLRVSQKPSKETYTVLGRIVLIGIFLLGAISFLIRFLMLVFQGGAL